MYFVPLFNPCDKFECVSCGKCCGKYLDEWILELSPNDVETLCKLGYKNAIVLFHGKFVLKRKKRKKSCIFLDNDNLCLLRKKYGWYPLGCRLFPFGYYIVNSTLFITINLKYVKKIGCLGYGRGRTLGAQVDEVLDILRNEGIIEDYYVKI